MSKDGGAGDLVSFDAASPHAHRMPTKGTRKAAEPANKNSKRAKKSQKHAAAVDDLVASIVA